MASGELTAEELRARRKARITASGEQRLARILSGPSGEENRRAPCLEGGEPGSIEGIEKMSQLADTLSPIAATSNNFAPTLTEEASKTVDGTDLWRKSLANRRYEIIFVLAAILATVVTTYSEFNITLPWLIGFVSLEFFLKAESSSVGESQLLNVISQVPAVSAYQNQIRTLMRWSTLWNSLLLNSTIFYFSFICVYLLLNKIISQYPI
ncbi:unnamed protein product, partial [Mesorhabditis belari]|uniref:Uncharacterized protein n=1 Tax=Mesorhabditis belari TaxID=2138241 RepID=A0AAF3FFU8_9BILA